jgi:hypothetical protein
MYPRVLPIGFVAPCLPTKASQPPSGPPWLHEIKHDGFRVLARKDGNRVRLYSRPGNDLTCFPGALNRVGLCNDRKPSDHSYSCKQPCTDLLSGALCFAGTITFVPFTGIGGSYRSECYS